MDNGSHHSAEPSLTALLGGIINDGKDLRVQEVAPILALGLVRQRQPA